MFQRRLSRWLNCTIEYCAIGVVCNRCSVRSTSCAFSLFLVCALENGENGEKREKAVKGFQWMGMSAELFFESGTVFDCQRHLWWTVVGRNI